MYQFLHDKVADAMSDRPLTVSSDTPLAELTRLFDQHDFNGIPVVDAQQRLLGFVTKLDLLKAFRFTPEALIPPYAAIMAQPVSTVMTTEPVCVTEDMPLTRVLELMVDLRTKSFPVVRGERLVGIIAREDLLAALRRATA
ncbi:MAG TPA: CBS domain-containing protein [Candidatus Competibacteraceae bacterium]|nr:CBS domain-containing protein [Candidatus Competibacteraceae bacterium]